MAPLSNYLLMHRKRLTLSQEEVGFLIGAKGSSKGSTVSREEQFRREPSLQNAIAYEVIYGKPIRELFAGLYEEVEQNIAKRAKVLSYQQNVKARPRLQEVITKLFSKIAA